MSEKAKKITSMVLIALPSLMLVMSAVMKLIAAPPVVEGLTKAGLGTYIPLLGAVELLSVVLLWIPKTHKIGFLLLCGYLGGALSIELATGQAPGAAIFLTVLWIGVYLKDKLMFVKA